MYEPRIRLRGRHARLLSHEKSLYFMCIIPIASFCRRMTDEISILVASPGAQFNCTPIL